MDLTEQQAKDLPATQRKRLLCSYPVIVAQHFSHRFNSFMKFILNGDGKAIGEILDYFWRVEFQQRGSPHIHSLWWVKDAPNLRTVEGKRATPEFINKYITCRVPVIGEDDELPYNTIIWMELLIVLIFLAGIHFRAKTCAQN